VRSLSVVSGEDASDGEALVEVGPVQAERGELDVVELLRGLVFEPWVSLDREGDLEPARHRDVDLALLVAGAYGLVNQGAHSTYGL
jgi:hypothetical protein